MLQVPSDRVEVRGLLVTAIVGALPHERTIAQPLQIDLTLFVDLHDACVTDELSATADYGDVAQRVADITRESKDLLLERLAGRIADEVLTIARVEGVEVVVTKLRPPIPETLESTAVRILRQRQIGDADERDPHVAIVALGSNLGDRVGYLRHAVESLPGVTAQSQIGRAHV